MANYYYRKRLLKLLCTDVGALVLVCVYILFGTFLFQYTEQYAEKVNCQIGESKEKQLMHKYSTVLVNYALYNYTNDVFDSLLAYDDVDVGGAKRSKQELSEIVITNTLKKLRDDVLRIRSDFRFYGQNCDRVTLWSFPSALLFTITLVTTIGYGHVVPVSVDGKIVCICYSIIGIPLFLIAIARINNIITNVVSRTYFKARDSYKRVHMSHNEKNFSDYNTNDFTLDEANERILLKIDERRKIPAIVMIVLSLGYLILGGFLFKSNEGWTWVNSMYFSFVTLSSIGFGDYVPGVEAMQNVKGIKSYITNPSFSIGLVYILIGMPLYGLTFQVIQDFIRKTWRRVSRKLRRGKAKVLTKIRKCEEERNNEGEREKLYY